MNLKAAFKFLSVVSTIVIGIGEILKQVNEYNRARSVIPAKEDKKDE